MASRYSSNTFNPHCHRHRTSCVWPTCLLTPAFLAFQAYAQIIAWHYAVGGDILSLMRMIICRWGSARQSLPRTTVWTCRPAASAAQTLPACVPGVPSAGAAASPWTLSATSSAT